MPKVERTTAQVFLAPTARRRYFTAAAAANAEARAQIRRKYPTEKGDISDGFDYWDWTQDSRLVAVHARLSALLRRALLAAAPADTVEHGCYCDLEPHMQPDGCVLEEGRPQDCSYARSIDKKEQCEYWIPVTRENHQKYGVIWSDKPPAEGK